MLEAAFRKMKLDWRYLTIEVLPENLEDALAGMKAMGLQGLNLTIPHKIEVMKYLDAVADDASLIGAVNTVRRDGDRLIGENTDGKGFLESLRIDGRMNPAGKEFLILGAGGAARALCTELALAGARSIRIVNRTVSRAEALASHISRNTAAEVSALPWTPALSLPSSVNVLVNATSIGLFPDTNKPDLNYDSIRQDMLVCDVIPNPPETEFLKEASRRGARTLDGLGMLVYQGAIGFKMWTGLEAPVDEMKEALIKEFQE